jgi:hypothetical protein
MQGECTRLPINDGAGLGALNGPSLGVALLHRPFFPGLHACAFRLRPRNNDPTRLCFPFFPCYYPTACILMRDTLFFPSAGALLAHCRGFRQLPGCIHGIVLLNGVGTIPWYIDWLY